MVINIISKLWSWLLLVNVLRKTWTNTRGNPYQSPGDAKLAGQADGMSQRNPQTSHSSEWASGRTVIMILAAWILDKIHTEKRITKNKLLCLTLAINEMPQRQTGGAFCLWMKIPQRIRDARLTTHLLWKSVRIELQRTAAGLWVVPRGLPSSGQFPFGAIYFILERVRWQFL